MTLLINIHPYDDVGNKSWTLLHSHTHNCTRVAQVHGHKNIHSIYSDFLQQRTACFYWLIGSYFLCNYLQKKETVTLIKNQSGLITINQSHSWFTIALKFQIIKYIICESTNLSTLEEGGKAKERFRYILEFYRV